MSRQQCAGVKGTTCSNAALVSVAVSSSTVIPLQPTTRCCTVKHRIQLLIVVFVGLLFLALADLTTVSLLSLFLVCEASQENIVLRCACFWMRADFYFQRLFSVHYRVHGDHCLTDRVCHLQFFIPS